MISIVLSGGKLSYSIGSDYAWDTHWPQSGTHQAKHHQTRDMKQDLSDDEDYDDADADADGHTENVVKVC